TDEAETAPAPVAGPAADGRAERLDGLAEGENPAIPSLRARRRRAPGDSGFSLRVAVYRSTLLHGPAELLDEVRQRVEPLLPEPGRGDVDADATEHLLGRAGAA